MAGYDIASKIKPTAAVFPQSASGATTNAVMVTGNTVDIRGFRSAAAVVTLGTIEAGSVTFQLLSGTSTASLGTLATSEYDGATISTFGTGDTTLRFNIKNPERYQQVKFIAGANTSTALVDAHYILADPIEGPVAY